MSAPTSSPSSPSSAPSGSGRSPGVLKRIWNILPTTRSKIALWMGIGAPIVGGGMYAADHKTSAITTTAAMGLASAGAAGVRPRYTLPAAGTAALLSGAILDPNAAMITTTVAGTGAAVAYAGRKAYEDLNPADFAESKREWVREATDERDTIRDAAALISRVAAMTPPDMTWAADRSSGECDATRSEVGHLVALEQDLRIACTAIAASPLWQALDHHETNAAKHVVPEARRVLQHLHLVQVAGRATVTIKNIDGPLRTLKANIDDASTHFAAIHAEDLALHPNEAKKHADAVGPIRKASQGAAIALGGLAGMAGVGELSNLRDDYKEGVKLSDEIATMDLRALQAERDRMNASPEEQKNKGDFIKRLKKINERIAELEEKYKKLDGLDQAQLKAEEKRLQDKLKGASANDLPLVREELAQVQIRIIPDMSAQQNLFENHPHFDFRATRRGGKVYITLGVGLTKANVRVEVLKPDSTPVHLNPLMNEKDGVFIVDLPQDVTTAPVQIACAVNEASGTKVTTKIVTLNP